MAGAVALALGLGSLELIRQLARPLALLILGISIAASLAPPVAVLQRRMPRTVAVLTVYLMLMLVVALIGWITLPPLIGQARTAITRIPDLALRAQEWLGQWDQIDTGAVVSSLTTQLGQVSATLVSLPLKIGSSLFDILLVIFISAYWLILVPSMERFVASLLPESRREPVTALIAEIGAAMGGYMRGTVINGAIVGVLVFIGMLVIGIDFALVLGLIAAVLEIVPVIGPVVSGTIIVALAFLQSPIKALIALIFVIAMQQLENNILVPNIMRSQTNVSPLLGMMAIIAGGTMAGLLGALIAIPIAAALRIFTLRVIAPIVRRQTGASSEVTTV